MARSIDITEMSERPKLEAKRTCCGHRASVGFDRTFDAQTTRFEKTDASKPAIDRLSRQGLQLRAS
jgi:hypothetical protein